MNRINYLVLIALICILTVVMVPVATANPGSFSLFTPTSGATVDTNSPTFSWQSADNARNYLLQVRNSAGKVVAKKRYRPAKANCQGGGTCTVTSPKSLSNGTYTWRVIAKVKGGKTRTDWSNVTVQVATHTPSTAEEMLNLVNGRRCRAGLAPLVLNNSLTTAAQTHSDRMASLNFFAHDDPYNSSTFITRAQAAGYSGSYMGENIAAGQNSVDDAFRAWWQSSGHKANIMNPSYREMGLGYTYNVNSTYHHYWTQSFGSRSGAPAGTCP
ncbi:MAG: CAP domain-containing protein [Anaerolineae bacterium]|nr:CAP domain-containing protein [Anaerolineae bacterium]